MYVFLTAFTNLHTRHGHPKIHKYTLIYFEFFCSTTGQTLFFKVLLFNDYDCLMLYCNGYRQHRYKSQSLLIVTSNERWSSLTKYSLPLQKYWNIELTWRRQTERSLPHKILNTTHVKVMFIHNGLPMQHLITIYVC